MNGYTLEKHQIDDNKPQTKRLRKIEMDYEQRTGKVWLSFPCDATHKSHLSAQRLISIRSWIITMFTITVIKTSGMQSEQGFRVFNKRHVK